MKRILILFSFIWIIFLTRYFFILEQKGTKELSKMTLNEKNWTIVNKVDTIYKEKCRVQLLRAVPSTILLFHLVSSFRENYAVS